MKHGNRRNEWVELDCSQLNSEESVVHLSSCREDDCCVRRTSCLHYVKAALNHIILHEDRELSVPSGLAFAIDFGKMQVDEVGSTRNWNRDLVKIWSGSKFLEFTGRLIKHTHIGTVNGSFRRDFHSARSTRPKIVINVICFPLRLTIAMPGAKRTARYRLRPS